MAKAEIECDGWMVYGSNGKPLVYTIAHNETSAWGCFLNGGRGGCETGSQFEKDVSELKVGGYTVRPVCIVSPESKFLIYKFEKKCKA